MKHQSLTILTGLLLGLLFAFSTSPEIYAQDKIEQPDIVVGVDGLACPFCAHGLEKKMNKLEGVEKTYIDINEGIVDIKIKKGATLSEDKIKEAVKAAGFTIRNIKYANKETQPASENMND